jgi:fucose 4-O-acetylase-like acetyltransferase
MIVAPRIRSRGPGAPARRTEIDALRVVAMVGVFAAHAAQPFNPWDIWHVQSAERSKWLGELVLFFAPWVMPLFVLIAGASAWHSLGKRSSREYLDERVVRLGIPFVVGMLVLVPPQVYFDRRQHGRFDGSFIDFYPHFFDGIYPSGNLAWAHLWFLAVLAFIALVTLPLFRWLERPRGHRALARLATRCEPNGGLLLLVIPMIGLRAILWMIFPHGRPIVTDWTNRTTLLATFVYGFALEAEPRLMRAVDRQWKLALAVAVTISAATFAWAWPGDFTRRWPVPFSLQYLIVWSTYTLGGLSWSLALLGAARAIRPRASATIDRARAMLNPFYLLHQTVIVILAFYLIPMGAQPIPMYLTLFAAAFTVTVVLSLLASRHRLTRGLLGVRTVARSGPPVHAGAHHDHLHRASASRPG